MSERCPKCQSTNIKGPACRDCYHYAPLTFHRAPAASSPFPALGAGSGASPVPAPPARQPPPAPAVEAQQERAQLQREVAQEREQRRRAEQERDELRRALAEERERCQRAEAERDQLRRALAEAERAEQALATERHRGDELRQALAAAEERLRAAAAATPSAAPPGGLLTETEARLAFFSSLANVYPQLSYEVVAVQLLDPPPELRQRYAAAVQRLEQGAFVPPLTARELRRRVVFHTTSSLENLQGICREGLRPSRCAKCLRGDGCGDPGWFGDHTKGVYVSKHADYTFHYSRMRPPVRNDEGAVLALELVTGRTHYMPARQPGRLPEPGYHAHESPNHLEFFVVDPAQLLPLFVVRWQAGQSRGNLPHDALQ